MSILKPYKIWRRLLIVGILAGCLCFLLFQPQQRVRADACTDNCYWELSSCSGNCDTQYNNCIYWGGWNCYEEYQMCNDSCNNQYNTCIELCSGSGGGGGGEPGDGHMWCDGWDRQGACAFQFPGVAVGREFRRLRGTNGYDWQTFLTWHPAEFDGFGRFGRHDSNVGNISATEPLPGQVPLHRWSTRKGFYYSIYYFNHGGDYVYGGIAGYVWPPSDSRGFPLYQFYSREYGHFYTNFPGPEISCQPAVTWDFQGAMARVNWPGPASLAFRTCRLLNIGPIPGSCDPFFAERCRQSGGFFDFNSCRCL